MGLKPVFEPACPKCDFKLGYFVRDRQAHPDTWVLNTISREHLEVGHLNDNVISINRRRSQPRFRKNIRSVTRKAS
jgi:hypothetical protein